MGGKLLPMADIKHMIAARFANGLYGCGPKRAVPTWLLPDTVVRSSTDSDFENSTLCVPSSAEKIE